MNTTCSQLGQKSRRKRMPLATVIHWSLLAPILAMGLITAPDLATAQGVKPTILTLSEEMKVSQRTVTLVRDPQTGELQEGTILSRFIFFGDPNPKVQWTLTPTNQYVRPAPRPDPAYSSGRPSPVGGYHYPIDLYFKAVGTYKVTFTASNTINGKENVVSKTETFIVGLEP